MILAESLKGLSRRRTPAPVVEIAQKGLVFDRLFFTSSAFRARISAFRAKNQLKIKIVIEYSQT